MKHRLEPKRAFQGPNARKRKAAPTGRAADEEDAAAAAAAAAAEEEAAARVRARVRAEAAVLAAKAADQTEFNTAVVAAIAPSGPRDGAVVVMPEFAAAPPKLRAPRIEAMFGPPGDYQRSLDLSLVSSVAEIVYRYVHAEIECPKYFQELLEQAVLRIEKETREALAARPASIVCTKARFIDGCRAAVNKRLYGKAPVEMFVSIESFMLLAQHHTPDAAFRLSLYRTMAGLHALHAACGDWISVSFDADGHSTDDADYRANLAFRCAMFPQTYTTTSHNAAYAGFKCTPIPRTVSGGMPIDPPHTPLSHSVVFQLIEELWPVVSVVPYADLAGAVTYAAGLQARYTDARYEHVAAEELLTTAYILSDRRLSAGPSVSNFMSGTEHHVAATGVKVDVKANFVAMARVNRREGPLSRASAAAVAAADCSGMAAVSKYLSIPR